MTATWQRRGVYRCDHCQKVSYYTRGDAVRFRDRPGRDETFDTNVVPYRCPYGLGFHLGHSRSGRPFIPKNWSTAP